MSDPLTEFKADLKTYKNSLSGYLQNEFDVLYNEYCKLCFKDNNKLRLYYDLFHNEITGLGCIEDSSQLKAKYKEIHGEYFDKGGKLANVCRMTSVFKDKISSLNNKIMVDYEWYNREHKAWYGMKKYVWIPYWFTQLWKWETFSTSAYNHGEFMNTAVQPIENRMDKINRSLETNMKTYEFMKNHISNTEDVDYNYLWVQHSAMHENTRTWIS